MKFLRLDGGGWVNMAHVVKISAGVVKEGTRHVTWQIHGVERHFGSYSGLDTSCEQWTGEIIPASPGWFVVDFYAGSKPSDPMENQVFKMPIVGWRVSNDVAYPICIEGVSTYSKIYILSPDGVVTAPEDRSWDSLAAFVAACGK